MTRHGECARRDQRESRREPVNTIDQVERGRDAEHPDGGGNERNDRDGKREVNDTYVLEQEQASRRDIDRDDDLEKEFVKVMEAPEVVDDSKEKREKSARDEYRHESPVQGIFG